MMAIKYTSFLGESAKDKQDKCGPVWLKGQTTPRGPGAGDGGACNDRETEWRFEGTVV